MSVGVHERTLVNSHHREFWGSMEQLTAALAVIMGFWEPMQPRWDRIATRSALVSRW